MGDDSGKGIHDSLIFILQLHIFNGNNRWSVTY